MKLLEYKTNLQELQKNEGYLTNLMNNIDESVAALELKFKKKEEEFNGLDFIKNYESIKTNFNKEYLFILQISSKYDLQMTL